MTRKVRLSALLLAVVLVMAVSATVFALGDEKDVSADSFVARVADILGLDEASVQGAFDRAAKDIRDESLQGRLDHLVEQGRLTEEQADEYRQWYESRPDGPGLGFRLPGIGRTAFHRGRFHEGSWSHRFEFGGNSPPSPSVGSAISAS